MVRKRAATQISGRVRVTEIAFGIADFQTCAAAADAGGSLDRADGSSARCRGSKSDARDNDPAYLTMRGP
jgi:translation elongation factor EF-1beta